MASLVLPDVPSNLLERLERKIAQLAVPPSLRRAS